MIEPEKWAQMLNAKLADAGAGGEATASATELEFGVTIAEIATAMLHDQPAQKAYGNEIKKLVLHMQGIHKIFKSIPEYAFPDRLGKQKALMPIEQRIDSLIAREREDTIA